MTLDPLRLMARPREIRGTPGSRIRVLLGQGGEDYLYFLDEDTGDREFQTVNWTATAMTRASRTA